MLNQYELIIRELLFKGLAFTHNQANSGVSQRPFLLLVCKLAKSRARVKSTTHVNIWSHTPISFPFPVPSSQQLAFERQPPY